MNTERSIRKLLLLHDLSQNDWSTRMLRERAELEEFAEREQQAKEARRRREQQRSVQQRAAQSNSDAFYCAVNAAINEKLLQYNQAVGQAMAQWFSKRKFTNELRELKEQVAELRKQLDERQSLAKDFRFARGNRGDKREPSLPVRTIQKVHYN